MTKRDSSYDTYSLLVDKFGERAAAERLRDLGVCENKVRRLRKIMATLERIRQHHEALRPPQTATERDAAIVEALDAGCPRDTLTYLLGVTPEAPRHVWRAAGRAGSPYARDRRGGFPDEHHCDCP